MTMQVIQHIELTTEVSSITFSSIPQDGTDLMILVSARSSSSEGGTNSWISLEIFPNDSSASRTIRALLGNGSSVSTGTSNDYTAGYINGAAATSGSFSNNMIYMPNYASSSHKTWSVDSVQEANVTGARQTLVRGLWSNTSAITSVVLRAAFSAGIVAGSSATLYKITKGSTPGVTVS